MKGVVTASGALGLTLAQELQPNAILLDISLPDIDGWRVLRRIKNDLTMRHIPVFLVSTMDHLERGMALGAQGILPKPISTAEKLDHFLQDVRHYVRAI